MRMFLSTSNNNKNGRLTTKSIRSIVKSVFKTLRINKSTHGFRHYYTTRLIQSFKGDLIKVAKYTRHRNIEMLQVYNDEINTKADKTRFHKAFKHIKLK